MKKFTKLFLSCAAVAALTAAVATSAMAADSMRGQITGTYYPEATTVEGTEIAAGTLTLTAPNAADEFKTVVVLDAADVAENSNTVQIKNKNVIGIDQVTASEIVVKLDATKVNTENKEYTVLIGGSAGQIYEGTFGKVSGVPTILGDVNGDKAADSSDAMAILFYEVGEAASAQKAGKSFTIASGTPEGFPTTTVLGDVNGDKAADSSDAMAILFYEVGEAASAQKAGTEVTGTVTE